MNYFLAWLFYCGGTCFLAWLFGVDFTSRNIPLGLTGLMCFVWTIIICDMIAKQDKKP